MGSKGRTVFKTLHPHCPLLALVWSLSPFLPHCVEPSIVGKRPAVVSLCWPPACLSPRLASSPGYQVPQRRSEAPREAAFSRNSGEVGLNGGTVVAPGTQLGLGYDL